MKYYYLDMFSGIGGFALGAYWAGLKFHAHYFSEVDNYAIQVYQKRFPEAELLGDIRNVDYKKLPAGKYLAAGGFPCQPHSVAGQKKGGKDERDLWPECARMLRELRPAIALYENVPGLFVSNGGEFFNRVLSDICESGYAAEWQIISAVDAGAPHLRKRVWIVAYPDDGWIHERRRFGNAGEIVRGLSGIHCNGQSRNQGQKGKILADTTKQGLQNRADKEAAAEEHAKEFKRHGWWEIEPDVGRVAHGIPFRVDRLKCLGNAVVPQIPRLIWEKIKELFYDE